MLIAPLSLTRFAMIWLSLAAVFMPQVVNSHILNMTEITVVPGDQASGVIRITIDLGQSLMTPEDYWAASTEPDKEKRKDIVRIIVGQLNNGIRVFGDGKELAKAFANLELRAFSLEAIKNPLTPQMAVLEFTFQAGFVSAAATGALTEVAKNTVKDIAIEIADDLELPWPCLVRIERPLAKLPASRLLTEDKRQTGAVALQDGAESEAGTDWLTRATLQFQSWVGPITWLSLGFQHIVPNGLDHIAFVMGLYFLSLPLVKLLWQISVFTLAHSITLLLATFNVIPAPANIVEPLIALSIVYVAMDNLFAKRLRRMRVSVVFGFGLIHGLGFASSLSALSVFDDAGGLRLHDLLLFNVGVELGQLSVILGLLVLLGWARNASFYKERIADPFSMGIAGVGLYWFVKRVFS